MAVELDFTSLDPTDTSAAQAPRQGTRWWWRATFPEGTDLHGIVARLMWRVQPKDAVPVLSLTEDDNQIIWDDRGGVSSSAVLRVDVSAEVMALILAPKTYRYDLEFVPQGDESQAYAVFFGKIALQPEVTK